MFNPWQGRILLGNDCRDLRISSLEELASIYFRRRTTLANDCRHIWTLTMPTASAIAPQPKPEMCKEQLRVCESSYEFYRQRCQLLETANENANRMIGDISNEYKRYVEQSGKSK